MNRRGLRSASERTPSDPVEIEYIVELLRRQGYELWPGARATVARLHGSKFRLRRRDYLVVDFVEVLDILPDDPQSEAPDLLAGRFIPLGYSGGHSVFFLAEDGTIVEFPSTDDAAPADFSLESLL